MTFKPGDIVQLNSGGSPMRVTACDGSRTAIAWTDTMGINHADSLPTVCLKLCATISFGGATGLPIDAIKGAIQLRSGDMKFIGTLPAGTRVEQLGDGRWVAVHSHHAPKVLHPSGIHEIELTPDDLAAIGGLKFPDDTAN